MSHLMRVCSTLWPVYVITLLSPVTRDLRLAGALCHLNIIMP